MAIVVGTDFGENNTVIFMVRLLLRTFSVAYLTHDNIFWPKWGGVAKQYDGRNRKGTSPQRTNANFA